MSYDNWKTTTPADLAHVEECCCPECHAEHDISELADRVDFPCCTEDRDERVRVGTWCLVCNSDAGMKGGICWQCNET